MDSIERMTRQRILDANDLLDAIEESEEEARKEAEAARVKDQPRGR